MREKLDLAVELEWVNDLYVRLSEMTRDIQEPRPRKVNGMRQDTPSVQPFPRVGAAT